MGLFIGTMGRWFVVALWLAVLGGLGIHTAAIRTRQRIWCRCSQLAMISQCFVAALAASCLVYLLVTENNSFQYSAEYTGHGIPLIYRLAAFWAGNEGSILFWALLVSMYGFVSTLFKHNYYPQMMPVVSIIITAVMLFYSTVLVFSANPFVRLPNSNHLHGLNPLLQHPAMAVHPMDVYLGLTGFIIPFAYVMAGLVLQVPDNVWFGVARQWTLISWLFLSIGIVQGAHWSYEELGWGGYWAWDPVENASLLPWLTSTAFLHSAMIHEKRFTLRTWNVCLVALTFLLTIFGSFLTRSGVVWSIHAFANAPLGTAFLVLLLVMLGFTTGVIVWTRPTTPPRRPVANLLSKESAFLLNNVLLLGCTFAVLWGTVFPILTEAAMGKRMMVSNSFYNTVTLPLGVCLLFIMALGPVVAWRGAGARPVLMTVATPLAISIFISFIVSWYMHLEYHRFSLLASLSFVASAFVVTTLYREFRRSTQARVEEFGGAWWKSAFQIVLHGRRRFGGYAVHLAMVTIAVGIAGSGAYRLDKQAMLSPGQSVQIGSYTMTFTGMAASALPLENRVYANLLVYRGPRLLGSMHPYASFQDDQSPTGHVSLYSSPVQDLYLTLLGTFNSKAVFELHVNPFMQWIWFGGYLFVFGGMLSLWPSRQPSVNSSLGISDGHAITLLNMAKTVVPSHYTESPEIVNQSLDASGQIRKRLRIQLTQELADDLRSRQTRPGSGEDLA